MKSLRLPLLLVVSLALAPRAFALEWTRRLPLGLQKSSVIAALEDGTLVLSGGDGKAHMLSFVRPDGMIAAQALEGSELGLITTPPVALAATEIVSLSAAGSELLVFRSDGTLRSRIAVPAELGYTGIVPLPGSEMAALLSPGWIYFVDLALERVHARYRIEGESLQGEPLAFPGGLLAFLTNRSTGNYHREAWIHVVDQDGQARAEFRGGVCQSDSNWDRCPHSFVRVGEDGFFFIVPDAEGAIYALDGTVRARIPSLSPNYYTQPAAARLSNGNLAVLRALKDGSSEGALEIFTPDGQLAQSTRAGLPQEGAIHELEDASILISGGGRLMRVTGQTVRSYPVPTYLWEARTQPRLLAGDRLAVTLTSGAWAVYNADGRLNTVVGGLQSKLPVMDHPGPVHELSDGTVAFPYLDSLWIARVDRGLPWLYAMDSGSNGSIAAALPGGSVVALAPPDKYSQKPWGVLHFLNPARGTVVREDELSAGLEYLAGFPGSDRVVAVSKHEVVGLDSEGTVAWRHSTEPQDEVLSDAQVMLADGQFVSVGRRQIARFDAESGWTWTFHESDVAMRKARPLAGGGVVVAGGDKKDRGWLIWTDTAVSGIEARRRVKTDSFEMEPLADGAVAIAWNDWSTESIRTNVEIYERTGKRRGRYKTKRCMAQSLLPLGGGGVGVLCENRMIFLDRKADERGVYALRSERALVSEPIGIAGREVLLSLVSGKLVWLDENGKLVREKELAKPGDVWVSRSPALALRDGSVLVRAAEGEALPYLLVSPDGTTRPAAVEPDIVEGEPRAELPDGRVVWVSGRWLSIRAP